jgi:hypothetical protein
MRRDTMMTGFSVALLILAGCGDGMVEVKGTVNVDGAPVQDGAIAFFPADGKGQTSGGPIMNGQYAFKSSVGKMKVTINASRQVGTRKLYDTPDSKEIPIMEPLLGKKFSDREATTLEYEVTPGSNQKDWDIKTK